MLVRPHLLWYTLATLVYPTVDSGVTITYPEQQTVREGNDKYVSGKI